MPVQSDRSDEMVVTALKRFAVGYGLLVTLAAGGLAFANIFGFAVTAISFGGESAPDTTPIKTWMNIGWVFGVSIALLGAVIRFRKGRPRPAPSEVSEVIAEEIEPSSSRSPRHGLLPSAAWGGFFGALLGTALGASFVLLWFSIAYSPFAPKDWATSVTVERQSVGASRREEPVALTDHPVALYAFGLPVALGAIGGAVFGGVVRVSDE